MDALKEVIADLAIENANLRIQIKELEIQLRSDVNDLELNNEVSDNETHGGSNSEN